MKVCSKCNRNYDASEYNNMSVCLDDGAELIMVLALSPETLERMKTQSGEGYAKPIPISENRRKSIRILTGFFVFLLLVCFGLAIFIIFQFSK